MLQTKLLTKITELEATVVDLDAQREKLITAFISLPSTKDILPTPSTKQDADAAVAVAVNERQQADAVDTDTSSPATDDAALTAAKAAIARHISLLHSYNAIRDIGQGLFGLIADGRGVRVRDIHAEFGMNETD